MEIQNVIIIGELKEEVFVVRFPFEIGKSFLDYGWHPITIPKKHYPTLEQEN